MAKKVNWRLAACIGAGISTFFAEEKECSAAAIRTCNRCPIREACLQFAVTNRIEHGVWGGKTAVERTAEKRRKAREARYARAPSDRGRENVNRAG